MRRYRVAFRTFGCRLNQAESEQAAAAFQASGAELVAFGSPADVVVFNTCTVTSKAEQKARRELRLALRLNPDALALATGCYAELDGPALEAIGPRVLALPGSQKGALGGLALALAAAVAEGFDPLDEARRYLAEAAGLSFDPFSWTPGDQRHRSRAALKIEDGCDNRCTYCRVCLARGKALSLAPALVVERARELAALGYPEIVLTGVNLSQYRAGGLDFPGLLKLLCDQTEGVAYRVSSYEPDTIDDSFLEAFALPRVRPFLHLALQSGSDAVLRAMGRSYRRRRALAAALEARAAKGDPFVSADLIVGFPGEGESEFQETMAALAELDPAWLHAFTFSPRPGTKAAAMSPRVPERVAAERAAAVAALARAGRRRFTERRLGAVLEAMPEIAGYEGGEGEAADTLGGAVTGAAVRALSADYLRLSLSGLNVGPDARRRASFSCRVVALADEPELDAYAEFEP